MAEVAGSGGDADEARDEREQHDEGPDDERVGAGHGAPSGAIAAARRPGRAGQAADGGREDERREREDDEQDEQDDRELPQPSLDAAPAAVDRRIATERAGQAGAAGLQQDRDDERDAHDDLADGQERVHGVDGSSVRYGDGCYHKIAAIGRSSRAQRGRPAKLEQRRRDVGQDAVARAPTPRAARPTSTNGTGLSEWAVTGLAVGVAHLVGVAVVGGDREERAGRGRIVGIDRARPRRRSGRGRHRSTASAVDRRVPDARCGRPCPGWRSWRR